MRNIDLLSGVIMSILMIMLWWLLSKWLDRNDRGGYT